jgi:hypothetical protein
MVLAERLKTGKWRLWIEAKPIIDLRREWSATEARGWPTGGVVWTSLL